MGLDHVSMGEQGRAGWVLVREGVGPHPGGHTPRPDDLLQHGGHLLRAHVAQAADGDGWNGRGTRQATCNPERPGYVAGPPARGASPTPTGPKGTAPASCLGPQAWPSQGLLPIQLGSLLGLPLGQHPFQASTHCPIPITLPGSFPRSLCQLLTGKPHPREAASGSGLLPTCVFQQCLRRVGPVDDLHQIVEDHLHIGLHLCP